MPFPEYDRTWTESEGDLFEERVRFSQSKPQGSCYCRNYQGLDSAHRVVIGEELRKINHKELEFREIHVGVQASKHFTTHIQLICDEVTERGTIFISDNILSCHQQHKIVCRHSFRAVQKSLTIASNIRKETSSVTLLRLFKATPMENVRAAARTPAIVASVLQAINGLVFIGEGVMTGCQNFLQLSLSTCVATAGCLWALKVFPAKFGLTGVWMGFGVFNILRQVGVWIHQFYTSPITPKAIREAEAKV